MQINNTTNSQNFTAIRIVKANNKQFQHFKDAYPDFMKKNNVFKAKSFNHNILLNTLSETAHNLGQKVSWMLLNAKNHGIVSFEKDFQAPMYVFTGIDKFKLKLLSLKEAFTSHKYYKNAAELSKNGDLPRHLLMLKGLKDMADDNLPAFEKFLLRNKAKTVKFSEFLEEIKNKKI